MFKLFRHLKPMSKFFIVVVILLASSAMAELFLPRLMSDIINDGIYLKYEEMYEHEEMKSPFGTMSVSSGIDGVEEDTIPVFEMKDGFSTADLSTTWNASFQSFKINFKFMDIQVRTSKQLFNDVLMPFMDSIREYQFYKLKEMYTGDDANWEEDYYSSAVQSVLDSNPEVKEGMKNAFNRLIDFDNLEDCQTDAVNINTFLSMWDEDEEEKAESTFIFDDGLAESDVWDNEDAKRLLISCVLNMKHSKDGNLLPIPVYTENGVTKKVPVDAYGEPLDKSLLTYVYDDDTGRISALPDYELILCNGILGYAYKYENGQKWIHNSITMNESEIDSVAIVEVKNESYWKKLGDILSLSKVGVSTADLSMKTEKTKEEWLTPDGITIQTADMDFILDKGITMLGLTLFASVFTILAMFLSSKIAAYFSKVLRSMVFRKVEGYSLSEFDKFSTASLVTRSTNDINQIQNVFLIILRTTLSAPVTIIGGFAFSFNENVSMTMTLIYILPILFLAAGVAASVVQPLFKVIQVKVDQLTLMMREGITGVRVVRAFNQQDREVKRFNETNVSTMKTAVTIQRYCAILVPLINICLNCASVGIMWRAATQVYNGTVDDVGGMMAVSQYITQIAMALVFIASAIVIFPRASASAERIHQVMDTEVSIKDMLDAKYTGNGSGDIVFDNVSFKYSEEAEYNILEDISFTCKKGEVTAIVGGTGSGKSSIISLIPRFYDINGGTITIDGQDVKSYPQKELRDKIGFIPQKSILFSGTIADNLRYGKEDATEQDMWEALKIAQSDTFVREKENMLEFAVEQGGGNFSGGQKQRLSIARAVVRKPEIYIFDDSFSALDFKTDAKLRQALRPITQESVVIIVAQRIGTIMDADNILVLNEGKIVGAGTHKELIKSCKVYQDIGLSQMTKEELGL